MDNKTIDIMIEIGEELGVEVEMMSMDGKKFSLERSSLNSYKWEKDRLKWNDPYKK